LKDVSRTEDTFEEDIFKVERGISGEHRKPDCHDGASAKENDPPKRGLVLLERAHF
jgi:hypothetical protein